MELRAKYHLLTRKEKNTPTLCCTGPYQVVVIDRTTNVTHRLAGGRNCERIRAGITEGWDVFKVFVQTPHVGSCLCFGDRCRDANLCVRWHSVFASFYFTSPPGFPRILLIVNSTGTTSPFRGLLHWASSTMSIKA